MTKSDNSSSLLDLVLRGCSVEEIDQILEYRVRDLSSYSDNPNLICSFLMGSFFRYHTSDLDEHYVSLVQFFYDNHEKFSDEMVYAENVKLSVCLYWMVDKHFRYKMDDVLTEVLNPADDQD